jgi:hypothetical protein
VDDNEKPVDLLEHRTGLERVDIIGRLTLEAVLEAQSEMDNMSNRVAVLEAQRDQAILERDKLRAANVRLEHDLTVARALLDQAFASAYPEP